jgi:hypothetical protein
MLWLQRSQTFIDLEANQMFGAPAERNVPVSTSNHTFRSAGAKKFIDRRSL